MTHTYIVTDEEGCYRLNLPNCPQTGLTMDEWACNVEDAAQVWARRHHTDYDCPAEMIALVTDPNGKRWRVEVTVEMSPVFHVYRRPEDVTE